MAASKLSRNGPPFSSFRTTSSFSFDGPLMVTAAYVLQLSAWTLMAAALIFRWMKEASCLMGLSAGARDNRPPGSTFGTIA